MYAVVRLLTLFVVVCSLHLDDVDSPCYEILIFAVLFVLNRDENDVFVDRQIPQNANLVVAIESLPFAA